jgi:hypothetical protein
MNDVSELPAWPEKHPGFEPAFDPAIIYWRRTADAYKKRAEALVKMMKEMRFELRHAMTTTRQQRIDALLAEVERLRNHTNMWNGCTCWSYTSQEKKHAKNCVLSIHAAEVADLRSQISARDAQVTGLKKYIKHNHGCAAITWREGAVHCTCGLDAVLSGEPGQGGEG